MSPFDDTTAHPGDRPLPRYHALLVGGADEDQRRIGMLLTSQNILSTTASGAEPAIALLEARPFDLVVSDITLRGRQEGLDLGRWLRRHQPQTGLILLSDTFPWIPANSPVAGVPVLVRPLDWMALANMIAAVLPAASTLASADRAA
jgi:CheY-like chemotaxis protein